MKASDTTPPALKALRGELDRINRSLLRLLNRRIEVVRKVRAVKLAEGIPVHQPEREQRMTDDLLARNPGPLSDDALRRLFREIFEASLEAMERDQAAVLKVSRASQPADHAIRVRDVSIGPTPFVIAGPCAVESEEQMDRVAGELRRLGVRLLRGGAWKPRSSPYAFQGLGQRGLEILRDAGRRHGMVTVSEVMDPRLVEVAARHVDILQIGARNMTNYDLLREVGRAGKPVLLKRGMSATLDELLWAAEYVVGEGNRDVLLCERGIRTFEHQTRNTLDISAVPLLRQMTWLPVVVDVSHAAGRKDILPALGRAALAAGASGLMVEVHPNPATARSDAHQQMDFSEFRAFLDATGFGPAAGTA